MNGTSIAIVLTSREIALLLAVSPEQLRSAPPVLNRPEPLRLQPRQHPLPPRCVPLVRPPHLPLFLHLPGDHRRRRQTTGGTQQQRTRLQPPDDSSTRIATSDRVFDASGVSRAAVKTLAIL